MNPDPRQAASHFGVGSEEVRRRHILPKALIVGLTAGLLGAGFRVALKFTEQQRVAWQMNLSRPVALVAAIVIGVVGGGFSLWLVRRFAPEAAGSGIPHLKSVVLGERVLGWRRLLPVKFIAGVCGIGGGL